MAQTYTEQRKLVKNLVAKKQSIEQELAMLVEQNNITEWTKKRVEFYEICHTLQAAKQYLKPLKNVHVIETTISQQYLNNHE